jgi:hypothetical protein
MSTRIATAVVFVCACLGTVVRAQDLPTPGDRVRLETLPMGAEVWWGDSLLGVTPLTVARSRAAEIVVWHPARSAWRAKRDTIAADAPDASAGVVLMRFARRLTVTSMPHGAAVFEGDSLIGYTPVSIDVDDAVRELRLERPGCDEQRITVGEASGDVVTVVLAAAGGDGCLPPMREQTSFFRLPDATVIVPAGVGLLAGIAAVVLKQEADASYDRYRTTADGALLDRARRYDIYAGVALAASELALAWLVYKLFSSN